MLAFLWKSGVVHDRRLDRTEPFDLWQNRLAHFAEHGLVRPRRIGHEMQQRLVFRRRARRRGESGHWLDALALARQQQPGAIVVQRHYPVGVADHASDVFDVGFEP